MRVACFASGSSGNAFLVQAGSAHVLVDAGLPSRELRERLAACHVDDQQLSAILISHEHSDHVAGLPRLLRHQQAPILATGGTLRALSGRGGDRQERLIPGIAVELSGLRVIPVEVPHDAAEPVGFVLEHGDVRIALFTDLGSATDDVCSAIRGASLVVLESNYDDEMLARGPYPAHLKRRIRGPRGHLSNADCSRALAEHLDGRTQAVWLAHLSHNNNHATVAHASAQGSLTVGGVGLHTLPRSGATLHWNGAAAAARPRQLGMF